MKKFFCVTLSVIFVLMSVVIPVSAETETDDTVMPCFTSIAVCTTAFTISGLEATATAALTAQYKTSLSITIQLQKETSTGYETVKTWAKTGNGINLLLEESRLINVFANYRIRVTYVADGETTIVYKYE